MPESAGHEKPSPEPTARSVEEICGLLLEGDLGECELIPWGSNYTFAVPMSANGGASFLAIYKPREGEAPLWDFPRGTLYRREVAAFLTSEALGWGIVPPTVVRAGPHGVGSLQLYVEPDEEVDYAALQERHADMLRRCALFDMVINNADRKAGHCFLGRDGRVWAIDHGLTFHAQPKLRTVIWDFRDEPVPPPWLQDIRAFRDRLEAREEIAESLEKLLDPAEIRALKMRIEDILADPVYPSPRHHRHFPWPPY
ncbi:MAG: SCO1664 family protein [Nitrospinota bacterium]